MASCISCDGSCYTSSCTGVCKGCSVACTASCNDSCRYTCSLTESDSSSRPFLWSSAYGEGIYQCNSCDGDCISLEGTRTSSALAECSSCSSYCGSESCSTSCSLNCSGTCKYEEEGR